MTKRTSGIYKLSLGKYIYIGQSINIESRIKQHKKELKGNYHSNKKMQNVFNKYKTFEYKILFKVEKELLTILEQICMNYYPKELLLNIAAAEQLIRTEEWKQSISKAHKTSLKAKAARQIIHEKRKGSKLNKEHYENVCAANAKRKGIGHTEATKLKMSTTRQNNLALLKQASRLGLSQSGKNNWQYQTQEYIYINEKLNDVFEGTKWELRKYLNKPAQYAANLQKLHTLKQKSFFGYKLIACKLPYQGIDK